MRAAKALKVLCRLAGLSEPYAYVIPYAGPYVLYLIHVTSKRPNNLAHVVMATFYSMWTHVLLF